MARKTFLNGYPLPASDLNTYLMDQTVQTYADATARTAALATPTEGQMSYLADTNTAYVYDGSSWNAVVDAKNYGTVLPTRRNAIINGGFDVWQRFSNGSTSVTAVSNGVAAADRWYFNVSGSFTASQQTTGVPAGSRYCMRVLANGAQIARSIQFLETSESLKFAGKTATAQIKIRRNSTLTQDIVLAIQKSPTVDAGIGATWTTISSVTIANASMPTGTTSADWYKATLTVSVPNDGTANSLRFYVDSGTIPNGGYYEIAEVQFEEGSVATPFARAGGTVQGELAACQRYTWKYDSATASGSYMPFMMAHGVDANNARGMVQTPVRMRTTPTLSFSSASTFTKSFGNPITAIAGAEIGTDSFSVQFTRTAEFSFNQGVMITANNTKTAWILAEAEL